MILWTDLWIKTTNCGQNCGYVFGLRGSSVDNSAELFSVFPEDKGLWYNR